MSQVGLLTPHPTPNLEGQDADLSDPSPTDLPGMVRPTRSTRLQTPANTALRIIGALKPFCHDKAQHLGR